MSAEVSRFQEGFVREMQANLDSLAPEQGKFLIRYWSDSYAIEFTPTHSSETHIWHTFFMRELLNKVTDIVASPEDAATLLHQQRPIDPDGSIDDLR